MNDLSPLETDSAADARIGTPAVMPSRPRKLTIAQMLTQVFREIDEADHSQIPMLRKAESEIANLLTDSHKSIPNEASEVCNQLVGACASKIEQLHTWWVEVGQYERDDEATWRE